MRIPRSSTHFAAALVLTITLAACASAPTARSVFPTPGSARTVYTNASFAYLLTYPSQWRVSVSQNGARADFVPQTTLRVPDALAIDIHCVPNPGRLSPQVLWQRTPAHNVESIVGMVTLSSGTRAFATRGHAQTAYMVYTATLATTACQVTSYEIDAANARYVMAAVNTFTWLKHR